MKMSTRYKVDFCDGASAATLVSGLKKFIAEAESKLGGNVKLVIYTGPSFWIDTLGNPNLSANPLWIAHYTSAAKPIVPAPAALDDASRTVAPSSSRPPWNVLAPYRARTWPPVATTTPPPAMEACRVASTGDSKIN